MSAVPLEDLINETRTLKDWDLRKRPAVSSPVMNLCECLEYRIRDVDFISKDNMTVRLWAVFSQPEKGPGTRRLDVIDCALRHIMYKLPFCDEFRCHWVLLMSPKTPIFDSSVQGTMFPHIGAAHWVLNGNISRYCQFVFHYFKIR